VGAAVRAAPAPASVPVLAAPRAWQALDFISDLHLTESTPRTFAAWAEYLRGTTADAVFILGDLFEAWVGDDVAGEPATAVRAAIRAVADAGVPVFFQRGNRDFLAGARFAADTGATLLPDPAVVNLYGEPTLLMHGDLLCTQDWRYQRFRRVVRNRWVQAAFLRLPLSRRKQIIGGPRRMSEGEKQAKQAQVMDVEASAVEEALRQSGCARLIHGHTHRPARHLLDVDGRTCERWVLSDWYRKGQYLRVSAAGVEPVDLPFDGLDDR